MYPMTADPYSVLATTGFAHGGVAAAPLDNQPAIAAAGGPGVHDLAAYPLLSFRNPVTWFGIFAATTFGLIAVSSSVRVGKARASAKIGKE